MKTYIRKIIPDLKTFYDRSPQRFWMVIAMSSLALTLTMLIVSYQINHDFFINITLNFIVTAVGMIVTFIFFDRRIDKIREKIDLQRNSLVFEKLNQLERMLITIDNNTKPSAKATKQEASTPGQRIRTPRKRKKK